MPSRHTPDLRQLAQIVAVAELGSIAAASRALGIAQPALSRSLRDVEERVGAALFVRSGAGARPSAAGEALVAGARSLLAQHAALLEETRRRAAGESGTLVIGFNETVSWGGIVPETLRRFRAAHSNVRLVALQMNSARTLAALAASDIELGIMFGRPAADRTLAAMALTTEPIRLAVHRDDPLSRLPEPVPFTALADAPLIWFDRTASPAYHDQMLAALATAGIDAQPAQTTTNTSAMLALVNAGAGYSFVPAAAAHRKPAEVVLRSIARPDLDQRLEVVWRTDDVSPLNARFVDCARAVLRRAR